MELYYRVDPLFVLWHMGSLHPVEKVLVALLAFGPFLVLGVVVHLARRRQLDVEREAATDPAQGSVSDAPPTT